MSIERKFEFDLPLHCGPGQADYTTLKMEGNRLEGVTDLTIRAGANGFTNVVIGFEMDAAVRMAAKMVARLDCMNDEKCFLLSEVYSKAKTEIDEELEREGSELDAEIYLQAQFVRRVLEILLEECK